MKQRVISAMIGLLLLAVVLAFYETVVFNVAVTALVALAVFELLRAAKLTQFKPLCVLCLVFSVLVPILQTQHLQNELPIICGVYAFLLFVILIKYHTILRYDQLAFAFLASVMIPFSFTTIIFIHDRYKMPISMLYILIALGGAWLTDSGAYFVGRAFGKHKMAPNISPHKTVEGAVGGVLVNTIFYCLIAGVYIGACGRFFGIALQANWLALVALAPFASLAGILGDLVASVIKRQCGIKDFGSIMPGHGGVMDRFDSVLFVAPMVYLYIRYVDVFTLVL